VTGVNASRQLFDLDCMGAIVDSIEWDFPDRPAPSPKGGVVDAR
jgi:hypothetical protein